MRKLLVVGNGMAGMACVDQILQRPHDFEITVLSEEPHYNYNRILLSSVLAGEKDLDDIYINTRDWYEKNAISLRLSTKAVDVDPVRKRVFSSAGGAFSYDVLLLATGSDPFIPPMEGIDKEGVFTFRNIGDTKKILEFCRSAKKAVVVGGGLLGLEAARGIREQGPEVSVIHNVGHLMNLQLDEVGGQFLKKEIERLGIRVLLPKKTRKILGNGHVMGMEFEGGETLEADMVVIACGIRPNVGLAKKAGLTVYKGIVVNDHMETSDPAIFAVGECAEHRGKVYGLVAPLYDQGRVLADTITGRKGTGYEGSTPAAKLKVMGIELFSTGEVKTEDGAEAVSFADSINGVYKKLILKDGHLVGAILIGETSDANRYLEMIRGGGKVDAKQMNLLTGGPSKKASNEVMGRPDSDTICGCIGVSKGQIIKAVQEKGCRSVAEVKACTKASSGCGTCAGLVKDILANVAGGEWKEEKKVFCPSCVPFAKEEIRRMIKTQRIKNAQDVLDIYGNGTGCNQCKPALAFLVDEVWQGEHEEDRSARFINDRVHANIQKDGSFSVVPRMRGGVTSPDELRKIADVADKYKVKMVKVTGSQRLDLLGVKKEDLPKIWKELGMPSGFAYAKAVRMVKSCVGTDFCRYGTQNSIATGIKLESLLEGLYTPGKVKMGVVGCPRNCAETTVKDIGLVGIEGGWQVVVGGAAGKRVREADILCTVTTTEEALEAALIFFQYYRENAEYLERTYDFVERIGIEEIRRETILAPAEKKKELLTRLQKAKERAVDPWKTEAENPVHPFQFKNYVLPREQEALLRGSVRVNV